jgi:hypothetical protein
LLSRSGLPYVLGVLKLQAVNVRRREPDLGVISPVPDPEPSYALLDFIEDLIERALAFLRRLAGIRDSIRLIAFHWAKVEQKRVWNSEKLSKFRVFNGLAG